MSTKLDAPALVPNRAPLHVTLHPTDELQRVCRPAHTLMVVSFRTPLAEFADQHVLTLDTGLALLEDRAWVEVWHSSTPVTYERRDNVCISASHQVLFASILVDEHEFSDLQDAGFYAYHQLLQLIQAKGYAYTLRVWNYFPHINSDGQRLERYQEFCIGRKMAMRKAQQSDPSLLPAATVVGSNTPGLRVCLLASRTPGIQVENPRQISAFQYPRRYGPTSPSFSRAVYKNWGDTQHLYISGTASIVGHESRHPDNVVAQLEECLHNVSALLTQAQQRYELPASGLQSMEFLKIYIRDPELTPIVRDHLHHKLPNSVAMIILEGAICRRELLLEIESVYSSNKPAL